MEDPISRVQYIQSIRKLPFESLKELQKTIDEKLDSSTSPATTKLLIYERLEIVRAEILWRKAVEGGYYHL